jgi:hypothetical protein
MDIVEPAVVEAPQPAVLETPVAQVGASVGAVNAQQAGPPLIVAKHDEVLAEQSHGERRAARLQLLAERGWLPVPAEQIPSHSSGTDAREEIVLFGA